MFKNKWIRVLGLFVFGAFISLVSMGGCGDDDGGGGGDFISEECDICPCKYFDVPSIQKPDLDNAIPCWGCTGCDPPDIKPIFEVARDTCLLTSFASEPVGLLLIDSPRRTCEILEFQFADEEGICKGPPNQGFGDLSANQTAACQKCLEQYATALNSNESITVSGQQPFMCTPSQ